MMSVQAKKQRASVLRSAYGSSHTQQGVALLTILLMVVVATVLASSMILKQQRTLRETTMLTRQSQAQQYALAGEAFAMGLLVADSETNSTDSVQDIWAKPLPPYPVEDGVVMARLEEQSGRFNLNNLYYDGKADKEQLAYFKRLLKQLGLAEDIAEAVMDWQDVDDEPTGNGGAENEFYAGQRITVANQPFVDMKELKQVRGIDAQTFATLAPHVMAVPNYSQINVNTANAPVLIALADTLSAQDVANWLAQRQISPAIGTVDDFFAVAPFNGVDKAVIKKIKPMLSTQSQYFRSYIRVNLSGRNRYLTSDIMRHNKATTAYRRHLSPFAQLAPKPKTS